MAFLIGQMWPFLLLVLVFMAAAGWLWRLLHTQSKLQSLEVERTRLREELVGFVAGQSAEAREADERAAEVRKTREAVAQAATIETNRELVAVRAERDAHAERIGALERELERATARIIVPAPAIDEGKIAALEAEIARLTQEAQSRPDHTRDLRELAWRARYYQARTNYLEGEGRAAAAAKPDLSAVIALERDRDAARAEAEALRTQLAATPTAPTEELQALKWRLRYLAARNRYLEGAAEDPLEAELNRRRQWRARYLDLRLEGARERERAAAAADAPAARAKWRMRYLDARVQHLEQRLAEGMTPPPAAEEGAVEVEALVPPGAEQQPVGLPAPRHGAPDDLTLINGVGPKTEATLHALGTFHFDQIAAWSPANIAWVDQYLRFRGRIVREHWVEQAQDLARGAQAHRRLYYETEPA